MIGDGCAALAYLGLTLLRGYYQFYQVDNATHILKGICHTISTAITYNWSGNDADYLCNTGTYLALCT